jgi:hypothetical protein
MLYGEIMSTDRRHGGDDTVDIACRALVAIGAVGEDDPLLREIRRIAGAVAGAAPVPGLAEPWASLVARFSKADGPQGRLAIGAVVDDLEGFSIRLDALTSEAGSFSISLAMSPGTPLLRFPGVDLDPSPDYLVGRRRSAQRLRCLLRQRWGQRESGRGPGDLSRRPRPESD